MSNARSRCKLNQRLRLHLERENAQAREYVRWIEAEDPRILQGFVGATVDICVEPGAGGIAVIGE